MDVKMNGLPRTEMSYQRVPTPMMRKGEIDVGKKFDLKKLQLNFRKVLGDVFLESVTYGDYQLEPTDSWETGELIEADIIKA